MIYTSYSVDTTENDFFEHGGTLIMNLRQRIAFFGEENGERYHAGFVTTILSEWCQFAANLSDVSLAIRHFCLFNVVF